MVDEGVPDLICFSFFFLSKQNLQKIQNSWLDVRPLSLDAADSDFVSCNQRRQHGRIKEA